MPITVDVREFRQLTVADTCAVWNTLSSGAAFARSVGAGLHFCIAKVVEVECLRQPWTRKEAVRDNLQARFHAAQAQGQFRAYSVSLDDLLDPRVLKVRHQLAVGEVATIALAVRTHQAVMTDDRNAREDAKKVVGSERVHTTPQLVGWLVFHGHLTVAEAAACAREHTACMQDLGVHLKAIIEHAQAYRGANRG